MSSSSILGSLGHASKNACQVPQRKAKIKKKKEEREDRENGQWENRASIFGCFVPDWPTMEKIEIIEVSPLNCKIILLCTQMLVFQ